MAVPRNIHRFLIQALVERSKKPTLVRFYGVRFEPYIFKWARALLPQKYNIYKDNQIYATNIADAWKDKTDPDLITFYDSKQPIPEPKKVVDQFNKEFTQEEKEAQQETLSQQNIPPQGTPSPAAQPTPAPPPRPHFPTFIGSPGGTIPTLPSKSPLPEEESKPPQVEAATPEPTPQAPPPPSTPKPASRPQTRRSIRPGLTGLKIPRFSAPIIRGGLGGIDGGFLGGKVGNFLNSRGSSIRFPSFRMPRVNLGNIFGGGRGRRGLGRLATSRSPAMANKKYALLLSLVIGAAVIAIFFGLFGGGTSPTDPNELAKQLTITKSGPAQVPNGGQINYSINVTYTGTGTAQIEVTDPLPAGLDATSISEPYTASQSQPSEPNIIKWNFNLSAGQSKTLTVTALASRINNSWIVNQAEGIITSSTQPNTPTGPIIPPTADNCSGKYSLGNPLGNFGDPSCDFTKDGLYQLLQQNDPVNAYYWFFMVISCESGYNPNAYNPNSASGQGAYGLYQMNPTGKGNGLFDAGDVMWTHQTTNAIAYNNDLIRLGAAWRYWECAKDRW